MAQNEREQGGRTDQGRQGIRNIDTSAEMSPDKDMTPKQGEQVEYDTGEGDKERATIPDRGK